MEKIHERYTTYMDLYKFRIAATIIVMGKCS